MRVIERLKQWLGLKRKVEGARGIFEILRRTPLADLDATVRTFIRSHSAEDARQAMVELIKDAPLSDFPQLKRVYFKHFAG